MPIGNVPRTITDSGSPSRPQWQIAKQCAFLEFSLRFLFPICESQTVTFLKMNQKWLFPRHMRNGTTYA